MTVEEAVAVCENTKVALPNHGKTVKVGSVSLPVYPMGNTEESMSRLRPEDRKPPLYLIKREFFLGNHFGRLHVTWFA